MLWRLAAQSTRQLGERLWSYFSARMADLSQLYRPSQDAKERRPCAVLGFDPPAEIAGEACCGCTDALLRQI
jgi:hypothetical protein